MPIFYKITPSLALSIMVLLMVAAGAACGDGEPDDLGPQLEVDADRRLISTQWLAEHREEPGLVIVDARRTDQYLDGHIPGAVSASFSEADYQSRERNISYGGGLDIFGDFDADFPFSYADQDHIEAAIRNLGIDDDSAVVIYDEGGTFHGAMVHFILEYYGHQYAYLLDGGIYKWNAEERPLNEDIRAVTPGNFTAQIADEDRIVDTNYVLDSLYHPDRSLISSLVPSWHFGSYLPYSRPGHIPSTKSMPLGYFVNADRTWRSTEEIQALFEFSGISQEDQLITYCGGGPLSTCGYFVIRHLLGHEDVRNYQDSLVGWLHDDRQLPLNLYQYPEMLRDSDWIHWWAGDRIQTLMDDAPALVLDVRDRADYDEAHIPWSVHLDMEDWPEGEELSLQEWAAQLGALGLGPDIEAVICDEGLTAAAAWVFWLLEYMGHANISICGEGIAGWQEAGYELTDEETLIADHQSPFDVAINPKEIVVTEQSQRRLRAVADDPVDERFEQYWVYVGENLPDDYHSDNVLLLPPSLLVDEQGRLWPADILWENLDDAGVPWFREIITDGNSSGAAAMAYLALRILGFPMVRQFQPDRQ